MLTVKHERPSQRLQHRVTVPIKIDLIGEGLFEIKDWSLNSVALKEYTGSRQLGDEVDIEVSIPFQGFDISFNCRAEVVRRTEEMIALRFLSMDDRGRDILNHFIEEIIRGSITSTDEVLRRIDTPVTPVTTTEEASGSGDLPIKRMSWKVVRMIFIHLTVGVIVLGYGGYFIYKNFFTLNVTTAVISATVNPLLSPVNGFLTEVVVRSGEKVNESEVLMRLSNPELENRIDFAKINIDRRLMELRVRRVEYRADLQKNEDFKRIAEAKLEMIESRLESLKARQILEDLRHDVIENDYVRGAESEVNVIDSSIRRLEVADTLDEARNLLKSRRLLLDSIERGTSIHNNIENNADKAKVKVEFAEDQLILAKDELSALKKQQRWMEIAAPTNGTVARWLRAPGTAVKKGEKLGLFEIDEVRVIKAFLTPAEALQIGLGDLASVYFPSLDRYVQAKISDIDTTGGMLSAREVDYIWRKPDEPSAEVTMEFVGIEFEEIRKNFPSGLPATVVFNQQATSDYGLTAMVDKVDSWWEMGAKRVREILEGEKSLVESSPEPQERPLPRHRLVQDVTPQTYSL